MASTKRSALAPGFTVDTTALHQYNTTNFVQYASFKPRATSVKHQAIQAASNKHQASSNKHQATSREQQAPRFYSPHKDTRG
jgi:dethiobiotin synthetase